jgi:nitroreductase
MPDELGVLEAIYTARGLRRFKPDPIPDEILARILEAATRAPNATNLQRWRFLVIKDAEVRKGVAGFYKKAAQDILPQVERIFLDETRYMVPMEKAKRRQLFDNTLDGFNHFDVPPVLVIACTYPEPPRWEGNEDVLSPFIIERMKGMLSRANASSIYHAVQNLTLAARNFGVATCMTNLHTLYEPEIKVLLGIPDEVLTWALLPLGYPHPDKFGPIRRKPISEVVFLNHWGNPWQLEPPSYYKK